MKKTVILLSFVAFLIACGNNATTEGETTDNGQEQTKKTEDPEVERGLTLVAQSDCLTCHQVEIASTGPAYTAIAERYPVNDAVIDSLAGKIIHGGAGNWGAIAMTPHPTVSEDDAKAMVKYVLSLKK